jgi:hypothetical protein
MYTIIKITDPETNEFYSALKFEQDDVIYWIPQNEGNRHYQEYLEWLAEGNTTEIINNEVE